MVNLVYAMIWFFALYKWGDWRNWDKYYPTLLFFMLWDLVYLGLLADSYPMWSYNPPESDKNLGITSTIVSLSVMVVKYPATVLIYLATFKNKTLLLKVANYGFWIGIYSINEWVDMKFNLIKYSNGWSFWWSVLFNLFLFFILKVHYKNPIVAWPLSVVFMLFLWFYFDVPASVFQ